MWNYRIVRYAGNNGYGLHEVFYDQEQRPKSMSVDPASFVGGSVEEVQQALTRAMSDAQTREVFDAPEEWRH